MEQIDVQGETIEEKFMLNSLKIALYNNLAACYLRLNKLQDTRAVCDEALLLDPNQTKALYAIYFYFKF